MRRVMSKKLTRREFLGGVAAGGAALGVGALLGGCKPAAPATPTAPPVGAPVTLKHYSMFSEGEPLQIYIASMLEKYQQEHPNVTIEPKWAGREVIMQLRSVVLAGEVPEFVDHSDGELTSGVLRQGLGYPMDDALETMNYEGDTKWRDTFIPSVLEGAKFEGKVYLIPRETYVSGWFYNVKMFEEFGLEIPKTWDEFLEACETIKGKGIAPIAHDAIGEYTIWDYGMAATRVVGPDTLFAAATDKTGELWKSEPGFLQAAEMVNTLAKNGYFQEGYEGSIWPAAQIQWVQSKTAMLYCGTWIPTEMSPETPADFVMDVFSYPKVEGGKGNGYEEVWSNDWVILKDAKNIEPTIELIKFLSSQEFEQGIVDLGSPIPLKGGTMPKGCEGQTKILEEAESAGPKHGGIESYAFEWEKAVWYMNADLLIYLKITPEEFIEKMAADTKAFYERVG